jgi:hypothetical protein
MHHFGRPLCHLLTDHPHAVRILSKYLRSCYGTDNSVIELAPRVLLQLLQYP